MASAREPGPHPLRLPRPSDGLQRSALGLDLLHLHVTAAGHTADLY